MKALLQTPAVVCSLLIWLCLLARSNAADAQHHATKRVLVLNSYHQGYRWTDDEVDGIQDSLKSLPVDLNIEYLDSRRHEGPAALDLAESYLTSKYARLRPDLIIATDDAAVKFLVSRHERLFPAVPVVFCGVNEYNGTSSYVSKNPSQRPWLAGVLETLDVDDTVDAALRLHPSTRRVYTVGEGEAVRYDEDLVRTHPFLKVERILDQRLSLEQIGETLQSLPRDSIVLASAFSRDGTGRPISMAASIEFVCQRSRVPVYGLNGTSLGYGIVGGKLNDGTAQGKAAGEMAAAILRGASPLSLGIQSNSRNPYSFDGRQLTRWGIDRKLLPPDSRVVGEPPTFYEQHRMAVWVTASCVVAQSLIIGLLIGNIRRRRRMQKELQRSEVRFRRLYDANLLGVAFWRGDSITQANDAYLSIVGGVHQDGRRPTEPIPRLRQTAPQEAAGSSPSQDSRLFETEFVRADGTQIPVMAGSALLDESDQTGIDFVLDISERKRYEQVLLAQKEELNRSNADLQQFAYVASHDLQEPLRAIVSYSQLLSRRYSERLDEPGREFLQQVAVAGQRMSRLVRDLLAYSRVSQTGDGQAQPDGLIEVEQAFHAAVANLKGAVEESQAAITAGPLPRVCGDALQMAQLLQNLIGNAIKYRGPEPPRIHVSAHLNGAEWTITVQDNGLGIRPEHQDRIFTIFSRLHGQEIPGTGIGLALCRRIVERHRGRIWVESQPGQGSAFRFTLPASPQPLPAESQSAVRSGA